MLETHFAWTLWLHKLLVISPQSLVLIIQRSMFGDTEFSFLGSEFVNFIEFLYQLNNFFNSQTCRIQKIIYHTYITHLQIA
jgi:hypothetical protein